MARYEHNIAHMMGLCPSMKVLDVGCRVGGPTKEIAAFSNCSLVGLNNGYQVRKAEELAKKDGMEEDGRVRERRLHGEATAGFHSLPLIYSS
jgi:sterol 24-C-methyltransferase